MFRQLLYGQGCSLQVEDKLNTEGHLYLNVYIRVIQPQGPPTYSVQSSLKFHLHMVCLTSLKVHLHMVCLSSLKVHLHMVYLSSLKVHLHIVSTEPEGPLTHGVCIQP